jgi:NTF2 fold immunity protein
MKALLVFVVCIGFFAITRAESEKEIYEKDAAQEVRDALQQKEPLPWKKDGLVVPTPEVAKAIHRAVAGAVYGQRDVDNERPFHAIRSGAYWVVFGSLPKGFVGGTAVTVIRASDGRVMRIIHYE